MKNPRWILLKHHFTALFLFALALILSGCGSLDSTSQAKSPSYLAAGPISSKIVFPDGENIGSRLAAIPTTPLFMQTQPSPTISASVTYSTVPMYSNITAGDGVATFYSNQPAYSHFLPLSTPPIPPLSLDGTTLTIWTESTFGRRSAADTNVYNMTDDGITLSLGGESFSGLPGLPTISPINGWKDYRQESYLADGTLVVKALQVRRPSIYTYLGSVIDFNRSLTFILSKVNIMNATSPAFSPGETATLSFDISKTGQSTINGWSVSIVQGNTTFYTFPPNTDNRGPGIATNQPYGVHVNLPWNALDANNNAVSGNFTWVISANVTDVAGGGAPGQAGSATARLEQAMKQNIDVNVTVTPAQFDPGNSTTTLSGVVSGVDFTPTNVKVLVSVQDSNGNVVRSYPETSGPQVQATWDGQADSGTFPGYGIYTFVVKATSDQGTATKKLEVDVEPANPTVLRISAVNNLNLEDDDGGAVSSVYFDAVTNITNPVAFSIGAPDSNTSSAPLFKATAATTDSSATINVTVQAPPNLKAPVTVLYKLVTPANSNTLTFDQELGVFPVAFLPGDQNKDFTWKLQVPQQVQVIKSMELLRKPQKSRGSFEKERTVPDRMSVTLRAPQQPYNDEKIQDSVLERACIYATGASNDDEAARLLETGLFGWLCWGSNHQYTPESKPNIEVIPELLGPNGTIKRQFLLSKYLATVHVSCDEVGTFYQIHAAALGIPMDTYRIFAIVDFNTTSAELVLFKTNPALAFGSPKWGPNPDPGNPFPRLPSGTTIPPTAFVPQTFNHHTVAVLGNPLPGQGHTARVWDLSQGYSTVANYLANGVNQDSFFKTLIQSIAIVIGKSPGIPIWDTRTTVDRVVE